MNPDVAYERKMNNERARKRRAKKKAQTLEDQLEELEKWEAGEINLEVDKALSDRPVVKQRRDPRGHPGAENLGDHPRRCTAHKKNGDRCAHYAIQGGTICGYHGGNNPAVKAKARARLESAADIMAAELLKMAQSGNIKDGVKLSAVKDALDRAGLAAKTAVSVDVGVRPFEEIIWDAIEHKRPTELRPLTSTASAVSTPTAPAELEVLDAELEPETPLQAPSVDAQRLEARTHRITRVRFPQMPQAQQGSGLVSFDEAVGQAARVRPPGPRRRQ